MKSNIIKSLLLYISLYALYLTDLEIKLQVQLLTGIVFLCRSLYLVCLHLELWRRIPIHYVENRNIVVGHLTVSTQNMQVL